MNELHVRLNILRLTYLLSKQDAKPCLIRWILLLQEYDIEIENKKGAINVAVDHLSRLEKPNLKELREEEINDEFPDEFLMSISTDEKESPWFADFANYLVGGILRKGLTYTQRYEMPLNNIQVSEIFDIWGIDFMRPFLKSHKFEYILVAIDYVSKWSEVEALPTNNVENTNRALKRILEKTVKDNPSIWSRKLDDALWAFRTTYKTPIGTTPYRHLYGKMCHLPFEIKHRAYWALRSCNPDLKLAGEKQFLQLHELAELRLQAYENSNSTKLEPKPIMTRNLESKWCGPFIVKHGYPFGYVELYDKHGGSFIVNGHRVKLYHDEEQVNELTTEEIHLMCEEGRMKAIPFMAPFPANYHETLPWASEKPYIYSVVENTCNEAKLYDLDETGKGIVIGNILYVPSEGISLGKK
ncbi:reverse transcriptase domain-containing protein [Tanacetum coccineum]